MIKEIVTPEPDAGERLVVRNLADAIWCGARGMRFAKALGFGEQDQWAVAIAVEELVTNAVKHALGGTLTLSKLAGERGLAIVIEDDGPGIANTEDAVKDGYHQGHFIDPDEPAQDHTGLGSGLGAVKRMTDHLLIERRPEGGTRVTAHKYLRGRIA